MRVPEGQTPDDHESPGADQPRPHLKISTAAASTWRASVPANSDAQQAAPQTDLRGLIISEVHVAASRQSNAAAALRSLGAETSAEAQKRAEAEKPAASEPRRVRLRSLLCRLSGALVVVYGTVLAWAVPLIGSGRLDPWPMYLGMGVLGAVAIVALRPARAQVLGWLAFFWVAWISTLPLGAFWSPELRASANAQDSVYASALVTLALVGLGPARPAAFRWLWFSVLLTTLPFAVREAVGGDYLYPWHGAPGAPVTVFVNPNNYATILVLTVGIMLGWMTERIHRAARWTFGALTGLCAWLIVATQSRAALVALMLVMLASAVLAGERHRPQWRCHTLTAVRAAFDHSWRARAALVGTAIVLPALATAAILAHVFPGDDETVRSDELRTQMVSFALDRWWEHPWFGTGAGTFERLWAAAPSDPSEALRPWVPPHNAFAEILSENGLVVAAPLAVLLTLLSWYALRPLVGVAARLIAHPIPETDQGGSRTPDVAPTRQSPADPRYRTPHGGLDRIGSLHLVAMHVLAFLLAGVVISSPLAWFPWWMMLSGAVVLTVTSRRPAVSYR